jgi:hypothetical protein
MPAPIDYGVQVADPMQSFLSAFQTGATIREAGLKQEQQTQQLAQQKLIQDSFAKVRGPNATTADYANLQMLLPKDQSDAVRKGLEMLSGERKEIALQQGGQVFSAFKAGKPEIAIQLMDQQIEGKRNAGDEAGAKFLETMRDVSKADPKAGEVFFGSNLAQMPGGDKMIESVNQLSEEARKAAAASPELRQKLADASKAETQARIALETASGDIATADAKRKYEEARAKNEEVKAQYAVKEAEDAIVKRLADLNLTKAQTNEFNVKTRNLDTTGKLLLLDYKAAEKGLPLPSKNAGTTTTVGNATEDERKAAGWLSQANNAYTNMLGAMYTSKGGRTGAERPNIFEAMGAGKFAQGEERQKFNQAASSLSEALLRAATGAGVNEAEAKQKIEELTPTLFDEKGNIEQKLAAIPMYLQSLQSRAGRAAPPGYTIPATPSGPSSVSGKVTPANSAIVGGQTYTRPANFTDAQWSAYKQSMGVQ